MKYEPLPDCKYQSFNTYRWPVNNSAHSNTLPSMLESETSHGQDIWHWDLPNINLAILTHKGVNLALKVGGVVQSQNHVYYLRCEVPGRL